MKILKSIKIFKNVSHYKNLNSLKTNKDKSLNYINVIHSMTKSPFYFLDLGWDCVWSCESRDRSKNNFLIKCDFPSPLPPLSPAGSFSYIFVVNIKIICLETLYLTPRLYYTMMGHLCEAKNTFSLGLRSLAYEAIESYFKMNAYIIYFNIVYCSFIT